jgi:DNA-binding PadR family transcriptional regulator
MAKENKTVYAILGLLNHEDMTGYDIKKRIDTSLKYFWDAGFGQIYPGLKALEAKGLVQCRNTASSTGPERITYSITDSGRKELAKWLSKPAEKEQTKYEILLKLFFGSSVKTEDNIRSINEFKQRNADNLKLFEAYGSQLGKILDQSEDHVYFYLTVLFGEKVMKAYLEWADEALGILGSQKSQRK